MALERAEWLASHDPLTGLPNRMLFQDRLAHGVARARRQEERLAVMMIDVDRFKAVNNSFGHPAGDSLLKELADRLSTAVRETDTLARLGGDEFALIQGGFIDLGGVTAVAGRLLGQVGEPFELPAGTVPANLSIGVAIFPDDAQLPDALLRKADLALYRAKASGRGRVCFYEASVDGSVEPLSLTPGERLLITDLSRNAG